MLVASSLVADAATPSGSEPEPMADRFYYKLAMAISGFYLSLILLVLIGWRATEYEDPVEVMTVASLWIAPIQGLAAAVIGIFVKRSGAEKKS